MLDEVFGKRGVFVFFVVIIAILEFAALRFESFTIGEGVPGFFAESRKVGGGDLKGVEDGAGGAALHLAELEGIDDLHDCELEGGGVLDEGDESRVEKRALDEVVEAAEDLVLEGRLGAALVVEADVRAARGCVGFPGIVGHGYLPLPCFPTGPTKIGQTRRNPRAGDGPR